MGPLDHAAWAEAEGAYARELADRVRRAKRLGALQALRERYLLEESEAYRRLGCGDVLGACEHRARMGDLLLVAERVARG
jgi:hypothetical protein